MLCPGRQPRGLLGLVAVRTTIREAANGHAAGDGEVVLLDEHPIWLDALEHVLSAEGVTVVGKATSPEAALALLESERPAGLVASVELPGSSMDGFECLRRARERRPGLRIVAFSTHHDPFHLSAAATAGADAYLPKTAKAGEVADTVRSCLASGSKRSGCSRELAELPPPPALTARELEIVHLVARGYTNVQIAQRLWVTKWTVKFHLANAYRKLGVSNRTQAARYLFDHGLSDLPVDRSA
jgi:DNA-binding NarL/FixJ family response regulator